MFNIDGGYYPVSITAKDTAGNGTTVDLNHSTLGEKSEASIIYSDAQVSQTNKVPTGESCILSVGVT